MRASGASAGRAERDFRDAGFAEGLKGLRGCVRFAAEESPRMEDMLMRDPTEERMSALPRRDEIKGGRGGVVVYIIADCAEWMFTQPPCI